MISSAGTLGSRRPTPRAPASRGAPASASDSATTAPTPTATAPLKRSREPGEDEVAYRELVGQRDALRLALTAQTAVLADLERSLLDFYYTHAVCYYEDEPARVELDANAAPASARTAYYDASEVARLRRALSERLAAYARDEAAAFAALAALEERVETDVVRGVLAERQAAAAAAEAQHRALLDALAEKRRCSADLSEAVAAQEAELAELQREDTACAARRAALEEKKRRQMENVESTRQELEAARCATARAQAELRRREAVVHDIQAEIDRRRERLKKSKTLAL